MRINNDKFAVLRIFFEGISERRITSFAAAGAYYLFMSLVPVIMLCCAILQYTTLTEEMIMTILGEYIPESIYRVVAQIVTTIYNGGGVALTVSIVLTIWSASSSMRAMMRGMDAAYDVKREENFIVFSLRACLYMIVFVVIIILSLIVMVYGGKILELIHSFMPSSDTIDQIFKLLRYLRFLFVMALLGVVFIQLYRWMPAAKIGLRHQSAGAAFSAVVWVIFSSGFSAYISFSDKFGAYGSIGTILVAMVWVYYCIFFLLVGGYLNHYLYLRNAPRITESEE